MTWNARSWIMGYTRCEAEQKQMMMRTRGKDYERTQRTKDEEIHFITRDGCSTSEDGRSLDPGIGFVVRDMMCSMCSQMCRQMDVCSGREA